MSEKSARVLVIDDEPVMLRAWQRILPSDRFEVLVAEDGQKGLELAASGDVDAMVVDLMMPGINGLEVLRRTKASWPAVEVIIMTAYATVETAVEALKAGAYDFLVKPFNDIDDVVRLVGRAVDRKQLADLARRLEAELEARDRFGELIGTSPAMKEVFATVAQVAHSDTTVLIQGESGTGKELVARAVHFRSPRRGKACVPVNCGALSESLLESELFGHERGAFTGANRDKKGLFEAANHGTLFLDEVGELSPGMQVRLLRALDDGEIKPVGSTKPIHVDVRVIAATNRNLTRAVAEGTFREDLYYRLNVIVIDLPPLRDRPEDIPVLAYHFLKLHAERLKRPLARLDADVLALLQAHRWDGNVRELENVMERAVVLQPGETVTPAALPEQLRRQGSRTLVTPSGTGALLPFSDAKKQAMDGFERRYLLDVLQRADGNISQASRLAGLDRSNFRRMLKRHDLSDVL